MKSNVGPAPVALFVYSRFEHTVRTVEALLKNVGSKDTDMYIFSDAPYDKSVEQDVESVRNYIRKVKGFKSVNIIERKTNYGLAKNIIDGVSFVISNYGKIIVVEDDLITSRYFLKFMNDALMFYENEKKVWHISGWNCPVEGVDHCESFLWRTMNCWGWATWEDRWRYFDNNVDKFINSFTPDEIYRFNLEGSNDFWRQVIQNKKGKINTWAIFWYATIFRNRGLCLNPIQSFVKNIGLDGSGMNCGIEKNIQALNLNQNPKVKFPENMEEDSEVVEKVKEYYRKRKKPLTIKAINRLSRIILGRNIIL